MSTPSPGLVQQAVEACRQHEVDTVYACLVAHFGGSISTRTVKEVLLRTFGIHIISLASYGHLLSLQGLTKSRSLQLVLSPIVYFFFPELPLAQCLYRVMRVSSQLARGQRASYRYYVATCLGGYVDFARTRKPLEDFDPSHLRLERKSYTWLWFGRLVVLLLLSVQYTMTLAIWCRALFVYNDRVNAFYTLDFRTFEMVLGGQFAVVNSICITLAHSTWRYTSTESDNMQFSEAEIAEIRATDNLPSDEIQKSGASGGISSITRSFLKYAIRKDDFYSKKLSMLLPLHFQFTVEHAMIAQHITEVIIRAAVYRHYSRGRCNPITELLMTQFPDSSLSLLSSICRNEPPTQYLAWLSGIWPMRLSLFVVSEMVIARIVLSRIIRLIKIYKRPAGVTESARWIIGRRSTSAFAIAFAGLLLNVILRSLRYAHTVSWSIDFESDTGGDYWSQMQIALHSYKDPWYDNMYVL